MMMMMMMNCICGMVDRREVLNLHAGITVRDSHHCKSPTRHDQVLDLRRT